jgi:AraC-like ligand binding domain
MISKRERAALLSGRTLTSQVTCHTEAAERILPEAPDRQQHTHDFAFFTYVISGSVHETIRGSEQIATQYECRFLPAGEPHANRFRDGAHLLQLSIHGDYIRDIEEHSPISMHLGPLPLTFGAFAIRLHRELHIADSSSPLDIESLATTLLCRDQGLHKGDIPPKWLTTAKELLCDCVTKTSRCGTLPWQSGCILFTYAVSSPDIMVARWEDFRGVVVSASRAHSCETRNTVSPRSLTPAALQIKAISIDPFEK